MHITTSEPTSVGVISDTHNLLRPSAERLFKNCNFIIHAGDIGDIKILHRLETIAPVMAVRGNTDNGFCFENLLKSRIVDLCGISFYIIHDLTKLDLDPVAAGIKVVVSGHTHKPEIFEHAGVTYINPGSAGYYRTGCPIALALISIKNKAVSVRIIRLNS